MKESSTAKSLHIVSLDVPYPPDYGGMIDVYYTIKHLAALGVKIYLHCFEYGRGRPEILNTLCAEVHYYERKDILLSLPLTIPYTICSRRSTTLLTNLLKHRAPILFEGVHSTYYLDRPELAPYLKIIRNQNVEQEYHLQLTKKIPFPKKIIYLWESHLFKKWEAQLHNADIFLTVAQHDYEFFKQRYPKKIHEYIPSFQPEDQVNTLEGKGDYCLYQGNLSNPENEEAALFLLNNVFNDLPYPLVLAGKSPTKRLKELALTMTHVQIEANPSVERMKELVQNAQINVLVTSQATGLKLKLLQAIFNGRHVLVNSSMVAGTGLSKVCILGDTPKMLKEKIMTTMDKPFTKDEIICREKLLEHNYDNSKNAKRIIQLL